MHVGWVATFDGPAAGVRGAARPPRRSGWRARRATARSSRRCRSGCTSRCGSTTRLRPGGAPAARRGRRPRRDRRRDPLHAAAARPPAVADLDRRRAARTDGLALIGKMHHCMVDGAAVAELGRLLLDAEPDGRSRATRGRAADARRRRRRPRARLRARRVDRAADGAALALAPARLATSPRRHARAARRSRRTLAHTLLPPAPGSPLNRAGHGAPPSRARLALARRRPRGPAALRRHAQRRRARRLRGRAAALRRAPRRAAAAAEGDGARRRPRRADDAARPATASRSCSSSCRATSRIRSRGCEAIGAATAQRRRDGEAEDVDAAFGVLALTPPPVQRALAHAFAHPRLFNLTISSVPGPAVPRYLRGCRLREVHSAVPLVRPPRALDRRRDRRGPRLLRAARRRGDAPGRRRGSARTSARRSTSWSPRPGPRAHAASRSASASSRRSTSARSRPTARSRSPAAHRATPPAATRARGHAAVLGDLRRELAPQHHHGSDPVMFAAASSRRASRELARSRCAEPSSPRQAPSRRTARTPSRSIARPAKRLVSTRNAPDGPTTRCSKLPARAETHAPSASVLNSDSVLRAGASACGAAAAAAR